MHQESERVKDFILDVDEQLQPLLWELRHLLLHCRLEDEGMVEYLKWQIPFYTYQGKNICYLNPKLKEKGVDLGFVYGVHLVDEYGLLVGNGKQVRHIKIKTWADIAREGVEALIKQAMGNGEL